MSKRGQKICYIKRGQIDLFLICGLNVRVNIDFLFLVSITILLNHSTYAQMQAYFPFFIDLHSLFCRMVTVFT